MDCCGSYPDWPYAKLDLQRSPSHFRSNEHWWAQPRRWQCPLGPCEWLQTTCQRYRWPFEPHRHAHHPSRLLRTCPCSHILDLQGFLWAGWGSIHCIGPLYPYGREGCEHPKVRDRPPCPCHTCWQKQKPRLEHRLFHLSNHFWQWYGQCIWMGTRGSHRGAWRPWSSV